LAQEHAHDQDDGNGGGRDARRILARGQRLIAGERDEHRQRADRVRDHQQGREYVDVIGPVFHERRRPAQEIV
jgi:hypothetical protein